jgi:hypothetical protein
LNEIVAKSTKRTSETDDKSKSREETEMKSREKLYALTLQKIESSFDFLLTLLLGSLNEIPEEMMYVTHDISRLILEKYGSVSQKRFIRGYFFLRYICPTLAVPNISFQVDISKDLKSFCLLMSKILQGAANQQEFQNHPLEFANGMIARSSDKMETIVSYLGAIPLSSEQKKLISSCRKTFLEKRDLFHHPCPRAQGTKSCCSDVDSIPNSESLLFFADLFEEEFKIRKAIKRNSANSNSLSQALEVVSSANREFQVIKYKVANSLGSVIQMSP